MPFELRYSVFPILALRPQEDTPPRVYCDPAEQGSAFFLSYDGLFLTAKHVLEKWSVDSYSILAFHFGLKAHKRCRVLELEFHPSFDLAIGRAEKPGPSGWPYPLTLSGARIGDGSTVHTFGYAGSRSSPGRPSDGPIDLRSSLELDLFPRRYDGRVVEYLARAPLLAAPCYHISRDPGGGISGAPLIRKRTGFVHGIFCAGLTEPEGRGSGFAVDLASILWTWEIALLGRKTLFAYADQYPTVLSVR